MVPLRRLKAGDKVALYPFKGVQFEQPSDEIILDEGDINRVLEMLGKDSAGNARLQILNQLKRRKLIPLRYNSESLPYIIKIFGYLLGDGTVYFENKTGKGISGFYGKKADLAKIQEDIQKIGFTCSKIYSRKRNHNFNARYGQKSFSAIETSCKMGSSSFAILLYALGMPAGNKVRQPFSVPSWLKKSPLWQRRLFLASFFGAEMSSPKCFAKRSYNFYCPVVSINKSEQFIENGQKFLEDISSMLTEFDVKSHKISRMFEYVSKEGIVSYRLRLIISGTSEDLINLYTKIGFEYNCHRSFLSNVAVQFLKYKQDIVCERERAQEVAVDFKKQGLSARQIYREIGNRNVNLRFIERSVYEGRNSSVRVSCNSLNFPEFIEERTHGLGESGMVWDDIISIEGIEPVNFVYDFTVAHPHHNFIANNFVVSNCGVRLLKTNFQHDEIKNKIGDLIQTLFSNVPSGLGSKGDIRVSEKEERQLLVKGAAWAVEKGYGVDEDLEATEEYGAMEGADPSTVSNRAYERGKAQSGTLGSGNHFLEVQVIDQLYDKTLCDKFGLNLGQVTVMIHSGSRGLGYQVCDDYVKSMIRCLQKYNINVPDRQLACAPINSSEGKAYLSAMKCAANYAWTNRQCLMHLTRKVFEKIFGMSWQEMGMELIYDVAHNIAKIESHLVDGKNKKLCVHRKGATRAFGPGHAELPDRYKDTGQPVIIPGDMGTNSYLLVGTQKAMEETFGSTCHGAGRVKSRTAASKSVNLNTLLKELGSKGIIVKASGRRTIVEEAPEAYKDINEVVDVVHNAGISKRVCRMRPIGVMKG